MMLTCNQEEQVYRSNLQTNLSTAKQSGTKPNLVAKIWLPTLVTICNGLPKLVANISSQIHH